MHRGITWDKVENPNPQSTSQVLPSIEEYTPPVTYLEEVKETIGIPIKVEPLDETPLEDLGLNTCNHDIPLSYKEIPNDPKKPYGFKPGLLGQSGSLNVAFSNLEVIVNNFLEGLSLPVNPKEVKNGRKAHLLEDKQLPSVRVFDEVSFYTLLQDYGPTPNLEEVLLTERGDGVAGIKRRRRDPSSDGIRDLVTTTVVRDHDPAII
ncbi:hypothetical protein Tco_0090178 [Tanacetum coccineum]